MTNESDQDARDDASLSVVTECDLPHPPEKVWRALTVPELLAAWLMPNDIDPSEGASFAFRDEGMAKVPIECEVLEAEPFRLLRYSWQDKEARDNALASIVTFELSRAVGGTRLRITHSGIELARGAKQACAPSAANINQTPRLLLAA